MYSPRDFCGSGLHLEVFSQVPQSEPIRFGPPYTWPNEEPNPTPNITKLMPATSNTTTTLWARFANPIAPVFGSTSQVKFLTTPTFGWIWDSESTVGDTMIELFPAIYVPVPLYLRPAPGEWHFYAIEHIWNGTGVINLYIDSVLKYTLSMPHDATNTYTIPFEFGYENGSYAQYADFATTFTPSQMAAVQAGGWVVPPQTAYNFNLRVGENTPLESGIPRVVSQAEGTFLTNLTQSQPEPEYPAWYYTTGCPCASNPCSHGEICRTSTQMIYGSENTYQCISPAVAKATVSVVGVAVLVLLSVFSLA